MSQFASEEHNARLALDERARDVERARKTNSKSLVKMCEQEFERASKQLELALNASREFDEASATLDAAKAQRIHDVATKNTSDETDRDAVERILRNAEVSAHVESVCQRKVESWRNRAISHFSAVRNVSSHRTKAIDEMERIAGALISFDVSRVTRVDEIPFEVIRWAPIAMAVVRENFVADRPLRSEYVDPERSPIPVTELDAAFLDFHAAVARARSAAREAAKAVLAAAE